MKSVKVSVVRPIRVLSNGAKARNDKWAKIVDAETAEVLHTGQHPYIKRLARKRYNHNVGL